MLEIDTIHQGDCLELMKEINDTSVDLVLTDPPYGIKADKGFDGFDGFGGFGKPIARKQYQDDWDSERPSRAIFEETIRIAKLCIIFGGNYFADLLPKSTHWLVWDKLNTMPTFGDCELIWTNSKRKSVKKYVVEWNGLLGKEDKRRHPAQKPVKLLTKIILDYTKPGDLICDPFLGSGSTAVAALNNDRHFIGIELLEEYCEVARRRIERETRQQTLPI